MFVAPSRGRSPTAQLAGSVAQRSQRSSDQCQIGSASSRGSGGVRIRGTENAPVSVGSSLTPSVTSIPRPARARTTAAAAAAAQATASAPSIGYDEPVEYKVEKGARIAIYASSLTPMSGLTGETRAAPRHLRPAISGLESLKPPPATKTDPYLAGMAGGIGAMPPTAAAPRQEREDVPPPREGAGSRGQSLPARVQRETRFDDFVAPSSAPEDDP